MRQTSTLIILATLLAFMPNFITAQQLEKKDTDVEVVTTEHQMPITSIEFQTNEFNWGDVIEGEKIQNVFEFTNTGTEPLIIINAKGSCGCTVPRFPTEPVLPGESANILVQFDSKNKGKVGGGLQSKRVTITTNSEPKNTYLTIKGKVFKTEDAEKTITRSKDFDIDANTVSIFPNPSSNLINLNLKEHAGKNALVEIFNSIGQRIDSKIIDEIRQNDEQFDISTYTTGTYAMSIKIEGLNRIAKQFSVL